MSAINRAKRQYARQGMQRLLAGGESVDDVATNEMRRAQQEQASQLLGAQQAMLNQQAMSAQNANQGMFAEAAKQIAKQSADAAIRASGEQAQFRSNKREEDERQALTLAQAQVQQQQDNIKYAVASAGAVLAALFGKK